MPHASDSLPESDGYHLSLRIQLQHRPRTKETTAAPLREEAHDRCTVGGEADWMQSEDKVRSEGVELGCQNENMHAEVARTYVGSASGPSPSSL